MISWLSRSMRAELLPADDIAEGFDNIATALQVSPSFIEQYVIAARAVAVKAVGRPDAQTGRLDLPRRTRHAAHARRRPAAGYSRRHSRESRSPADGEYRIDVADMATHIWGNGMEFENPLVVTLDNKLVYETVIGGEEDMKLYDQVQNGALDRVNARLKNIRFAATAGPHKIGVAFKRRTSPSPTISCRCSRPAAARIVLYRVNSFQLRGRSTRRASARRRAASGSSAATRRSDAKARGAGSSARRRSSRLSPGARTGGRFPTEDVNELLQYYQDGVKDGGFEGGIRSAITGLLASPFFLYRGEHVRRACIPAPRTRSTISSSRRSCRSSSGTRFPMKSCCSSAIDGKLSEPAALDRQVRRMLADPRSETLASNFVHQWLDMKRLDEIVPDLAVFPYASGRSDPREDFRTELTLFADSIFREDRSVVDLLRAKHTYLNERVALHYGITDVKGDRFRRVELKQSARWGLLGKGAILMAAAYPNRTSPVLARRFHPRAHPGRAAGESAARRPDAGREGHRHDQGAHDARDDGEASSEPDVRVLSRGHGSARFGARELRCDRQVAGSRSLCRRGDRFLR